MIHDLPQGPQNRQAAGESPEGLLFSGGPVALDEPSDDLRPGKILDTTDAFGGIGNIASRAIHDHTSKKAFSRRYRPIPGAKTRISSVTVLQSQF